MVGPFLRREGHAAVAAGPALGVIETASIARGLCVVDAMAKRSPVRFVLARPISPGRYVVLVTGDVAEVQEAMKAGLDVAAESLADRLELAQVAEPLRLALGGKAVTAGPRDSLGIIETGSVASAVLAADAACKAAEVGLVELRLADGIGGKGYFVLAGGQDQIEAALLQAELVTSPERFVARERIAAPHDDLIAQLA